MEMPASGISTSDLREYLYVIWRGKWFVILFVSIATIGAVAASIFLSTPVYSTGTDLLQRRSGLEKAFMGSDVFEQLSYDPERAMQTNAELVKSPEVVKAVSLRLGDELDGQDPLGMVNVSPITKADILRISATGTNPQLAADVANAFAEEFINWRKNVDRGVLAAAREPIEAQLRLIPPDQQTASNYGVLVDKLETLKLVESMQNGNLEVVKAAVTPTSPISPKPRLTGVAVFFVSLILSVSALLLRKQFDNRVRSAEEVTKKVDKPILAAVPKTHASYDGDLVTMSNPTGISAEAYRLLKTNLGYIQPDSDIKTIMVTSPEPGEGKSTTVANLAVTLARAGQRVIILEADLRRPMLARYLDLDNSVGLTNAITGNCSLRESLQLIDSERLAYASSTAILADGAIPDVMFKSLNGVKPIYCATSGPMPPNPGELAASDRVGKLIAEARTYADIVLIDAPPLGVVGDAASMASRVDGIVIVVRLSQTAKKSLDDINDFIESVPGNVLGMVVTSSDASGSGYAYSSYGGYYEAGTD